MKRTKPVCRDLKGTTWPVQRRLWWYLSVIVRGGAQRDHCRPHDLPPPMTTKQMRLRAIVPTGLLFARTRSWYGLRGFVFPSRAAFAFCVCVKEVEIRELGVQSGKARSTLTLSFFARISLPVGWMATGQSPVFLPASLRLSLSLCVHVLTMMVTSSSDMHRSLRLSSL